MATKTGVKKRVSAKTKQAPVPTPQVAVRPRRLSLPAYRPFRFKRVTYPERLPSSWRLSKAAFAAMASRPRLFLGIIVVYAVLTILFVTSLSGGADVSSLKQQLDLGISGSAGQFATSLAVFASLLFTPNSNASGNATAYQLFIGLIVSLATIWAVRQTVAGKRVSIRDAFYQGIYPLIPFCLVLFMVLLQTIPLLIGGWLFSVVVSNGIAATAAEQLIWGAVFIVLTLITIYMLCSSLFALYIVTLPGMTPLKALRSARQLVRYRRGQVFPKLLYMLIMLFMLTAVIMVPCIIFIAPVAAWVFFLLSMTTLIVIHAYMYTVYKALLA